MKNKLLLLVSLGLIIAGCQKQSIFHTFRGGIPSFSSKELTFHQDSTYIYINKNPEEKIFSYGKVTKVGKNTYRIFSEMNPLYVPLSVEEKYTGNDSLTFVFKDKEKPFDEYKLYFNINGIKHEVKNDEIKLVLAKSEIVQLKSVRIEAYIDDELLYPKVIHHHIGTEEYFIQNSEADIFIMEIANEVAANVGSLFNVSLFEMKNETIIVNRKKITWTGE